MIEPDPVEAIICWYVDFENIRKKKARESLLDLFDRLPAYQQSLKDSKYFQDEDELKDLGPQMLMARFLDLKERGVIFFNKAEGRGAYSTDEEKYDSNPKIELCLVETNDLDELIDDGIRFIADASHNGPEKKYLTEMGKTLKGLRQAQKSGRTVVAVSSSPYEGSVQEVREAVFWPRAFVAKTKDYDTAYRFLATSSIYEVIPASVKTIKDIDIPGLDFKLESDKEF